MKAARFLYFDVDSKVIVTSIMSTQVGYESNHIALLCDSVVSDAQNFCFLPIIL